MIDKRSHPATLSYVKLSYSYIVQLPMQKRDTHSHTQTWQKHIIRNSARFDLVVLHLLLQTLHYTLKTALHWHIYHIQHLISSKNMKMESVTDLLLQFVLDVALDKTINVILYWRLAGLPNTRENLNNNFGPWLTGSLCCLKGNLSYSFSVSRL